MRVTESIAGLVVILALCGCVDRAAQKQAERTKAISNDRTPVVSVAPAILQSVSETAEVSGQLVSLNETSVGAKVAGRIVSVYVRDGDTVSAGQVVAVQETANQMASLRQAESGAAAARAQLSQAISNSISRPNQSAAALRTAEAQLRSARAQLEKAKRGARSEELRQAEIQVQSAKSSMETARKEMDRQRSLYEQGAASLQRYEQAQNAYQQALSAYEGALEILNIRRSQTQPEDLISAEESVRQAQENVRNARAQKELDITYRQQVDAARANLRSAEAAVDLARQQIADATIRSPFSGKVSGTPVQPGTVLAPGTVVVKLIGSQGLVFEADVPETLINSVVPGSRADIKLTSYPKETFGATLIAISPKGDSLGRQFSARFSLAELPDNSRPGMFGTASIRVKEFESAVLVPSSAVISDGGGSFVFVVDGSKAKKIKVEPGVRVGDKIQVSGIEAGARVVVQGQTGLTGDSEVRVESSAKKEEGN